MLNTDRPLLKQSIRTSAGAVVPNRSNHMAIKADQRRERGTFMHGKISASHRAKAKARSHCRPTIGKPTR